MWLNLVNEHVTNTDAGIYQRNLVVFLQAVENIFLDSMLYKYPCGNKTKKKFGYFVNEFFYLEEEAEVKKIHQLFMKLYLNR